MIPKIYGYKTHWDTFNIKRMSAGKYVIKKDDKFYLIHDRCHHRGYHLFSSLEDSDNIDLKGYQCPVHGLKGLISKLIIEELTVDHTGLITNGWTTNPNQKWVKLVKDANLKYHSTVKFHNKGDWRYQVEMNADMTHVDWIHPWLKGTIEMEKVTYENGHEYLVQYWKPDAWWTMIYPFYQFEFQQGALYLAEIIPQGYSSYDVIGNFYFDDDGSSADNKEFKELMVHTYKEDLSMVSNMGNFYGPFKSTILLEDQVEHWHNWYWSNEQEIDKIIKGQ